MAKTIDDLRSLKDKLVARRRDEAYAINAADHDDQIKKVVQIHLAVVAINEVINEIEGELKPEMGFVDFGKLAENHKAAASQAGSAWPLRAPDFGHPLLVRSKLIAQLRCLLNDAGELLRCDDVALLLTPPSSAAIREPDQPNLA